MSNMESKEKNAQRIQLSFDMDDPVQARTYEILYGLVRKGRTKLVCDALVEHVIRSINFQGFLEAKKVFLGMDIGEFYEFLGKSTFEEPGKIALKVSTRTTLQTPRAGQKKPEEAPLPDVMQVPPSADKPDTAQASNLFEISSDNDMETAKNLERFAAFNNVWN